MLLGVHSLPQLSGLFAVSGTNTLPLRPSRCLLEQPGQSGTCVSEPWQAPIQSKCLPGVPSRAGAWGSCGLVERSWAGLQNSRDGVLGQCVASCVSLLRSLDISEPGFSICKMGSTGSTCPPQHMLLCFQNNWRNCFGGRRCCFQLKSNLGFLQNPWWTFIFVFNVSLSGAPVHEWKLLLGPQLLLSSDQYQFWLVGWLSSAVA